MKMKMFLKKENMVFTQVLKAKIFHLVNKKKWKLHLNVINVLKGGTTNKIL